jgi:transcriptional regulator with GAF, ATPase, and Fis domain
MRCRVAPVLSFRSTAGPLPTSLAESSLFGHKRGAFSGATADHAGLLRSADCGTMRRDKIGDMPLALQPALLRGVQEGEVLPRRGDDARAGPSRRSRRGGLSRGLPLAAKHP